MKPTLSLKLVKMLLADHAHHSFGELLDSTGISSAYLLRIINSLVTDGTIQTERVDTTTFYWLTRTS
jgi:DNA-binding MarR family transcriptional regulator